jgi:pyruvate dehydrogenase E2 component (dihydrolipoamide acetyltransferase)
VKPGDILEKDQPVVELETDKATIEVPSSVAGQVKEVKVKAGDKVKVGQAILSVEDGAAAAPKAVAEKPAPAKAEAAGAKAEAEVPEQAPVASQQAPVASPQTRIADAAERPAPRAQNVVDITRGSRVAAEPAAPETPPAPAAPSVRRTARELGVEINDVPGSGPGGRISIDDVKAYVKRLVESASQGGATAAAEPLPDFSRWGEVERQPMRAVRRKTAEHLGVAWTTVPHVTQFDLADITVLEELRKKYAKRAEDAGGNLTITAIAVKVVAAALKVFPQLNASVDMAADEIVLKRYVNIGIAVDTDRGLLVPVIRDADRKNIIELAVELSQLSEKARTRKIALEEMQGGCFSISNLGGLGGTYFTPIVNLPEVAILGISRARMEPIYKDGGFVPRLMLPLSLSYDHRVVDGADGVRFLRWVVEALEQPFVLALQG